YTTDDDNRLVSDGANTYDYDDEGNLIEKDSVGSEGYRWTYAWDNANHLVHVDRYDKDDDEETLAVSVDYTYDVFGNRIAKVVDSTNDAQDLDQRYALDGWNPAKPSPIGNENWDVVFDFHDDDG